MNGIMRLEAELCGVRHSGRRGKDGRLTSDHLYRRLGIERKPDILDAAFDLLRGGEHSVRSLAALGVCPRTARRWLRRLGAMPGAMSVLENGERVVFWEANP